MTDAMGQASPGDPIHGADGSPARSVWPVLVGVVVVIPALVLELAHHSHTITGHLVAFVAAVVLGVALVVVMFTRTQQGRSRSLMALVLSVGFLIAVVLLRTTPNPLGGDWHVMYGAPATVRFERSGDTYTEIAKTPVRVVDSECDIRAGTKIATLTGRAPTYRGQHGLWQVSNCAFASLTPATFVLDHGTLTATLGNGEHVVFTRGS